MKKQFLKEEDYTIIDNSILSGPIFNIDIIEQIPIEKIKMSLLQKIEQYGEGEIMHFIFDLIEDEIPLLDAVICILDYLKVKEAEEIMDSYYDQYDENFIDEQIIKGMQIESEHSVDETIQYQIAIQHLAENIHYYEALEKMEKELGIE